MTYGIELRNANNQVIIDGTYPNFRHAQTASNVINAGASLYYSDNAWQEAADVLVASPPVGTSGFVGITNAGTTGTPGFPSLVNYYPVGGGDIYTATTARVDSLRNFRQFTPAGGYGLNIWDQNNTLVFSATSTQRHYKIVETGAVSGSVVIKDSVGYPSTTGTVANLHKYFVLIQQTYVHRSGSNEWVRGFEYQYTSGTTGRILIQNYRIISGSTLAYSNCPLSYMIIKEMP